MTALRKYARLEATGLWRPAANAQAREVVVALGQATLTLADPRSQVVLGHWSLPAVLRRNPGEMPALYAPDSDPAAEVLELDDPAMIEAVEAVRAAVRRRRGQRGRGRWFLLAAVAGAVVLASALWLPSAITNHAARVLPFVKRQEIGRDLLGAMTRYTGAPCAAPAGVAALARLTTRLFGADGAQVVILRAGLPPGRTAHVPGNFLLADQGLVRDHDGPEVLAGHLLAEQLRAEHHDVMVDVLRRAGLRAVFGLLATGDLVPDALSGQVAAHLQAPPVPVPAAALSGRLMRAGVPLAAVGDLLPGHAPPADEAAVGRVVLLPDTDWRALQAICDG